MISFKSLSCLLTKIWEIKFFFLLLQLYFWIIANICFRDKSVYFYIFNSVIGIFLLFSSKKFKKSYNEDRIVRSFPLNSKDTCLFYCTYLRQFVQKITVSQGCKVRRLFMDIEHYCGVIFEKKFGHMSCCSRLFWDPKSKFLIWFVAFSLGAGPHKVSQGVRKCLKSLKKH